MGRALPQQCNWKLADVFFLMDGCSGGYCRVGKCPGVNIIQASVSVSQIRSLHNLSKEALPEPVGTLTL